MAIHGAEFEDEIYLTQKEQDSEEERMSEESASAEYSTPMDLEEENSEKTLKSLFEEYFNKLITLLGTRKSPPSELSRAAALRTILNAKLEEKQITEEEAKAEFESEILKTARQLNESITKGIEYNQRFEARNQFILQIRNALGNKPVTKENLTHLFQAWKQANAADQLGSSTSATSMIIPRKLKLLAIDMLQNPQKMRLLIWTLQNFEGSPENVAKAQKEWEQKKINRIQRADTIQPGIAQQIAEWESVVSIESSDNNLRQSARSLERRSKTLKKPIHTLHAELPDPLRKEFREDIGILPLTRGRQSMLGALSSTLSGTLPYKTDFAEPIGDFPTRRKAAEASLRPLFEKTKYIASALNDISSPPEELSEVITRLAKMGVGR